MFMLSTPYNKPYKYISVHELTLLILLDGRNDMYAVWYITALERSVIHIFVPRFKNISTVTR